MKEIYLTNNKISQVDDEDFIYLKNFYWQAHYAKRIDGYYAERGLYLGVVDGKVMQTTIRMSREIMEREIGKKLGRWEFVDHINHNTLDNRKENLRIVTPRDNSRNLKKESSSKYIGVSWNKREQKWRAYIYIDGKQKHLGYYIDEDEAGLVSENAYENIIKKK